jgi:hypothetical protein
MDLINKELLQKAPALLQQAPLLIEDFLESLPPEKKRLGLWIALSITLHTAVFYGVRVSYPSSEIPRLRTARVSLAGELRSDSEAANDPSRLMVPTGDLLNSAELRAPVQPRFEGSEELPPVAADPVRMEFLPGGLAALRDRAGSVMQPPRQTFEFAEELPFTPIPETRVEWGASLAARADKSALTLPGATADLLDEAQVTVLVVGVSAEGDIRHVLVEQSAGKSKVDDVAVAAIRRVRLAPVVSPDLVWGKVTVFWNYASARPTAPGTGAP